jgi:hypothetical protein
MHRRQAAKRALLELGAIADARTGRALGIREVHAVVGDELGAHLGGVVEHPVERAVAVGEHRARRDVDLLPPQAGLLEGAQ